MTTASVVTTLWEMAGALARVSIKRKLQVLSSQFTRLILTSVPRGHSGTASTALAAMDKDKDGALTLSLKLPADHKYTEAADSRWQVIADEAAPVTVDEAKASGALTGDASISIPVQLKDGAKDGLVRVEAIAYFCKDEGACQVSGVLFEIPVVLGQVAEKPLELKHTFNSQVAQFGLPLGQGEN